MSTELVVLRVDSGDSGTLGTRAGTALLEEWGPEEIWKRNDGVMEFGQQLFRLRYPS